MSLVGALGFLLFIGCGEDNGQASPDGGMDAGMDGGQGGADSGADGGLGERRIFVTATVQNADFGGITGADALCNTEATDAGLDGEYRAWLSTRASSVAERLDRSGGPFVLVDGTVIANDWADLVDGSIAARINLDAGGLPRGGDVWTGTLSNGDAYPDDDCAGFSSSTNGIALCGATASTSATWTENITPTCGTRLRLYCVEH